MRDRMAGTDGVERSARRAFLATSTRQLRERIIFSTAKSMTPYRRWSARNCCSWNRKTRRSRSICTSNRQAGVISSGLAMYDTMQYISAGAYAVHGHRAVDGVVPADGRRAGSPRGVGQCQLHVHQPLGGVQGQASDIFIHAEEMQRTKQRITRLYAALRRSVEEVEQTLDRDRFMSAEQACEWGLIDQVLVRRDARGLSLPL